MTRHGLFMPMAAPRLRRPTGWRVPGGRVTAVSNACSVKITAARSTDHVRKPSARLPRALPGAVRARSWTIPKHKSP